MYRTLAGAALLAVFIIWQSLSNVVHATEGSTHEFPIQYHDPWGVNNDTYGPGFHCLTTPYTAYSGLCTTGEKYENWIIKRN